MTATTTTTRALLVVDVQKDFCEGGALGVTGGNDVAKGISNLLVSWRNYRYVAASLDWHKPWPFTNGGHFSAEPDFVTSWPPHCQEGTDGAALHPEVGQWTDIMPTLIRKGRGCHSYSAFEGVTWDGERTLLADLRTQGITGLDVCGIATEHCVKSSVLDALGLGFDVRVLADLCAGVAEGTSADAFSEMRVKGAQLVRAL